MSEKTDVLIKALIKAKAQFKTVEKTKENPYFKSKYADLGAIDAAVMPALHNNGLTIIQTTEIAGIQPVLVTTLVHDSGQFISGQYPLNPVKNDPQGMGSAMTYARRYAISAILTVVADDDDDGNAASAPQKETVKPATQTAIRQPVSATGNTNVISEPMGRRLYAIWKSAHRQDDEIKQHLLAKYGFKSTKEITRDVYEDIEKWITSNDPPFSSADPEPGD